MRSERPRQRRRGLLTRRGSASRLGLCLAVVPVAWLLVGARVAPNVALLTPGLAERPGALLRAARLASEAGDVAAADQLLAAVTERHPLVGDHAARLRAAILLAGGEPGKAAAAALEALQRYPDSELRAELYRTLGGARERFGDESGARSAWAAGLEVTREGEAAAAFRLSIALSLERGGQSHAAAQQYAEIWSDEPTSAAASEATAALERLEPSLEAPLRDAEAWRRRGDRLFRARHNEDALAAYERALELGLSKSVARRVGMQRGYTLFRLRRYPEAVRAFESLPQELDVRLWRARSLARAGRVPESIREFDKLAAESHSELGVRARFLAAVLRDGREDVARARAGYERVAANRGSIELAHAALWRLAWDDYLAARHGSAEQIFRRLAEADRDPLSRLRARYWALRARERAGGEGAVDGYRQLAEQFPFTYYGWRARQRLPDPAAVVPDIGVPALGTPSLRDSELARPAILLEAGLREEAIDELRRLARRARGLSERLELAQRFTDAGDYHRAQRTVVDPYVERLARGPVPRFEELWWYAWPVAFAELVTPASERPGRAPAPLVLSIMREESGYRPAVLSVSGARGLLQIMIPTGERLARDVGRSDFDPDDLFDPDTNIDLGAHYLGQLSRRFPDRLSAAIASYNAGAAAVSGWIERDGHLADDEWVESIPYDQTRAYVKRVLRSLYAYRVLY